MRKYTNTMIINGEFAVRKMNTNAKEAYSNSNIGVVEVGFNTYDLTENRNTIVENLTFEELEQYFTELYNECFASEEE